MMMYVDPQAKDGHATWRDQLGIWWGGTSPERTSSSVNPPGDVTLLETKVVFTAA